jgi:hypothetical protein
MPNNRRFIFPRNLTARAATAAEKVIGNPVTSWMESGVGNCFPGLEFDVRILDCRFFPGLVFQYVTTPLYPAEKAILNQQGARVLYSDWLLDPMLPEISEEQWVQDLLSSYKGPLATTFMHGRWYLDWIEQEGRHISMTDPQGNYYDGELVWRLVRCLKPDAQISIGVIRRDVTDPKPTISLTGYRRRYVNRDGIFDEAYRPGELTEAMCNPWHHDFRDCACHYWASNHPDVVIRDEPPEMNVEGKGVKIPEVVSTRVNWLRARGPASTVSAFGTIAQNRRYEIDHYEINKIWEKLPFILEGREIDGDYSPPILVEGLPYSGAVELIDKLENELGPMELALAMQYLYALFSLRDPDRKPNELPSGIWPTLSDDLKVVRQFVLLVAIGEMTHLRWVNQLLWVLDHNGFFPKGRQYRPVVVWSTRLEFAKLDVELLPLTPKTVENFIKIERPNGLLDAAYRRCIATLRQDGYPKEALEIAMRIDADGTDHFQRFVNVRRILAAYNGSDESYPYLRTITKTSGTKTKKALELFGVVRKSINDAYAAEAARDYKRAEQHITDARQIMLKFRAEAENLAAKGVGVPLLDAPRSFNA